MPSESAALNPGRAVTNDPIEFRAQLELGRIYSRGVGVPTDHDEALRWYSAAAARDDDDCVEDPIKAAFVGAGTFEEVQEAKAYVANATRG